MTRCCANTGKTKVASHEPVPVLLADAVAGLCRLGARDGGAMSQDERPEETEDEARWSANEDYERENNRDKHYPYE